MHKNGESMRYIYIPGTTTNFTVKVYKKDLVTGYSSMVVNLLEHGLEENEDIEVSLASVLESW